MKTLQIGSEWFPERAGGLSRYYYELFHACRSSALGFRGVVVGSPKIASDTNGLITSFSSANRPLLSRLLAARSAIRTLSAEYKPDLFVSHFSLYSVGATDLMDRPLVVHFHGPWALESRVEGNHGGVVQAKRLIELAVYRRASRCIVLSEAFGTILHKSYGIPWERIRVISGAVDVRRFDIGDTLLQARERLGWPADRIIILVVRRLVRRMGLENVVCAIAEIAERYPDILLVIGGRGPLAADLSKLVSGKKLEKNVRLAGFIPDEDLPFAYRAADFSIVPSMNLEGFGLIAAESLAAGTPVLVTPVGGLPEVVRDLSENLILSGSTVGDIAERLIDVLSKRCTLPDSVACQSFAAARYGWDLAVGKIASIYEEACK